MKSDQIEKKTRTLFHGIHKKQAGNDEVFSRLVSLLSPEYLQESPDFFKQKICLDAGCGSNANATHSMLLQGAEKVYAFDLDESIFETAPSKLQSFEGKYELSVDNVLHTKYPDDFFDVVHCSGVLHHSTDVYKGMEELVRVTKPGGMLITMTYGKGGIIRDIATLLREKYQQDEAFRELIDTLDADVFKDFFEVLFKGMKAHGDSYLDRISQKDVLDLFDEDLALTIIDRIAAPLYLEHSEQELTDAFHRYGCTTVKRLKRYPVLHNIRRFLSPLYYDYESKYARLLYGDGAVQLKAIKS